METKHYIVKLHRHVELDRHLDQLAPSLEGSTITHRWASDFVNAYAGTLRPSVADYLRQHHEVDYIEEDLPMFPCEVETQPNAPWHLQRINQDARLSGKSSAEDNNWHYTYDSSAGTGVDIYILGIHIEHEDFGGRARWGPTFGRGVKGKDLKGHGTHVAGIAAGKRWGVAKAANLIAVKVANDRGGGRASNIIAGLEWVFLEVKAYGRPSVVNISRGNVGKSQAIHEAVLSATNAGIHVVVAAGNRDTEASGTCPANAPSALTVGASNIDDERWVSRYRKGSEWVYVLGKGSNYGPAVDIFAPGDTITSCETGTTKGTVIKSGTSMASPIVAGIVARLISMNGNLPPSVMADYLKRQGVKGLLDMKCDGTANLLARCCIRTLAVLSVRSTLAKFEVRPSSNSFCIPSFRKPDNVPASVYEGMSWNPKSPGLLQWGEHKKRKRRGKHDKDKSEQDKDESEQDKDESEQDKDESEQDKVESKQDKDESKKDEDERPTVEKSTPLLIVNDGSPVTFDLTHDAHKSQKGYYYAHAKVASIDMYSNNDVRSLETFQSCPVKTEIVLAKFSFNSDLASVKVTAPTFLRKAEDPKARTSRELEWVNTKDESMVTMPYIIITPNLVTDITLSFDGESSDTAETTFADCTYASTDKKTQWGNCPVETQTVFASFRYKSNWAKFEVTTPGASVRKDPGVPAKTYDDVEFKGPSIQWKTDVNKTYGTGSIPVLIVGPGSKINIALDCGSDGEKSGDNAGTCIVNFGNRVYSYVGTSKDKTFTGCPMQTVIANALLSFESNSAKVELKGGWLQKDPNADASIYDSNLEIKATSLTWASTGYVAKTLPFQILAPSPGLAVDIFISRGSDAKKEKDGKGSAIVTFGNRKYVNNSETAPGVKKLLFSGCRVGGDYFVGLNK